MRPRHAVLLTPSITLRSVPLPHYLPKSFPCHRSENSPVSPAVATLPKAHLSKPCICHTSDPPGGSHGLSDARTSTPPSVPTIPPTINYPLSFHILAHSFAQFCTRQKLNPFIFKRFRTLCTKPPGVGEGATLWESTYQPSLLSKDHGVRPAKARHPSRSTRRYTRVTCHLPLLLRYTQPMGILRRLSPLMGKQDQMNHIIVGNTPPRFSLRPPANKDYSPPPLHLPRPLPPPFLQPSFPASPFTFPFL